MNEPARAADPHFLRSAGWAVHCVVCLRRAACSVSAKMQGSGFVKASNRCMPLLMLLWTVRLLLQSCPWSPARMAACTVCSRRCSGHWSGTIVFGFVVVFVRWSLCRTLFLMFCEFFGERGGMWFLAVFRELELILCIVFSCYDFSYGSPKYSKHRFARNHVRPYNK